MKAPVCTFVTSAVESSGFPAQILPEVCFAGRSNVGKSSLINAVARRKGLAKVGAAPGKTRLVNYFLADSSFYLVDLPGYGFAKVSAEEKTRWGRMVTSYLDERRRPKLLCLLLDSRRQPSPLDLVMKSFVEERDVSFLVVATKVDKLTRTERSANLAAIRKLFPEIEIVPFSSVTGEGRKELTGRIRSFVEHHQAAAPGNPKTIGGTHEE